LSPLFALPSNLAPRKPRLEVLPAFIKSDAKLHFFHQSNKSKNDLNCYLYSLKIPTAVFLCRPPCRAGALSRRCALRSALPSPTLPD
jgi:hypothetical protein